MPNADAPLTRGHKKRARTRRQLLDAARLVLAEHGEGFSISDIAERAGVANGTFYNYFADRDELVRELVADVLGVFAAHSAREVDSSDPAERFARITALALAAAAATPQTVRVALRLDAAQRALLEGAPLVHLRADIEAGVAARRFRGPADTATFDVVIGSLLMAARRIAEGTDDLDGDYGAVVVERLLVSLGVSRREAARLATRAVDEVALTG